MRAWLTRPGGPGHAFYISWREGSRSCRMSTKTADKAEAEVALRRWIAQRQRPTDAATVDEVIDHYLGEVDTKRPAAIRSALKRVREAFGPLRPSDLHPKLFRDYARRRASEPRRAGREGLVGPRTPAIELAYLRAALRLAERDQIIERAPQITLPANAGIRRRTRWLSDAELAALSRAVQTAAPHIRLAVTLALMTGQRGIAIRQLRWEHVDWDRGVVWFSRTDPDPAANKQRQDIPLTPALARLLRAVEPSGDFVVQWKGRPVKSIRSGFQALVRRAGLEDVTFHDLRRTVATQALRRGHGFDAIAALLGDDVATLRQHYAHVDPKMLEHVMPEMD